MSHLLIFKGELQKVAELQGINHGTLWEQMGSYKDRIRLVMESQPELDTFTKESTVLRLQHQGFRLFMTLSLLYLWFCKHPYLALSLSCQRPMINTEQLEEAQNVLGHYCAWAASSMVSSSTQPFYKSVERVKRHCQDHEFCHSDHVHCTFSKIHLFLSRSPASRGQCFPHASRG